ncbi:MAG: anti-sigma factor [Actinomycetota bacterium]
MQEHLEQDSLALRALGEPVGAAAEAHLEQCEACRAALSELTVVTARAARVTVEDRDLPPAPTHLWAGIAAEADLADADDGDHADTDTDHDAGRPATPPPEATPEALSASAGAEVIPLRRRPRRAALGVIAASVVALALVGAISLLPVDTAEESAARVASTELDALDERAEPARAVLAERDGRLELAFDELSLPDADGYYEVWLIDADVEGMVSLGPVADGEAVALPDGLDPADFPIVDVSLEPYDGDPTHSGDSLLRGELAGLDAGDLPDA